MIRKVAFSQKSALAHDIREEKAGAHHYEDKAKASPENHEAFIGMARDERRHARILKNMKDRKS